MKVIYGGIRGSYPATGAGCLRYGGETTSVLVEGVAGERALIDLGTGARALARRLAGAPERRLLVLCTHYHLDHVIGLPSLSPLYDPSWNVAFAAPSRGGQSAVDVLRRLLDEPFWPLTWESLGARIDSIALDDAGPDGCLRHGALEVRWAGVHHAGGCTAYRVDEPATGGSLVFATDIEWPLASDTERARFLRLCREPAPAELLCFDGTYTRAQYPEFRNWGHSAWEDAAEVAATAGARRLHVIHHAPDRDDEALDRIDAELRRALPVAALAVQGEEILLGGE